MNKKIIFLHMHMIFNWFEPSRGCFIYINKWEIKSLLQLLILCTFFFLAGIYINLSMLPLCNYIYWTCFSKIFLFIGRGLILLDKSSSAKQWFWSPECFYIHHSLNTKLCQSIIKLKSRWAIIYIIITVRFDFILL